MTILNSKIFYLLFFKLNLVVKDGIETLVNETISVSRIEVNISSSLLVQISSEDLFDPKESYAPVLDLSIISWYLQADARKDSINQI